MNICCTGDWHFRPTAPRSRKDEYTKTQSQKINQVLDVAFGDKPIPGRDPFWCQFILQPGDFFDSATPPYWMVTRILRQLGNDEPDPDILTVYGQHDLRFHSNKIENTPLAVLEAAGIVRVLGSEPYVVLDEDNNDEPVLFYGCSWDEDIPKRLEGRGTHILVMHRMVIHEEKLWEAQDEYTRLKHLLRRHPFDLVSSGDNHNYFVDEYKGRWLVNCGSLMRTNIDQMTHEPGVVIFDTETKTIEEIKLDVASIEDVFRVEEAEAEKARNEDMDAFIELVKGDPDHADLDFLAAVDRRSRAKDVDVGVTTMVDRIIGMAME